MKKYAYIALLSLCTALGLRAEAPVGEVEPENKLRQMYQLYYMPFSIEFKQGRTRNDVLPYVIDAAGSSDQLLGAEALRALESDWTLVREAWRKKSLLLNTPVPLGGVIKISNHLSSHRISLSTGAFDNLPLSGRAVVTDALKGKSPEVQADFKQQRFVKRFVQSGDEENFTLVMFSASWCDSCKEYRLLIEQYLKTFPDPGVSFQSVVIEDPKEQIFDANILKELFPHPGKYSHDSIPRFLAVQELAGKTQVWEEGDALREFYDRYLRVHRGYLDNKTQVFQASDTPLAPKRSALVR